MPILIMHTLAHGLQLCFRKANCILFYFIFPPSPTNCTIIVPFWAYPALLRIQVNTMEGT